MSKRLILVLALAFVVGIAFAAYAEVQNVKVSGDLTVYGIMRELTLQNNSSTGSSADKDQSMASIARVRVDADLTDNVSATVRLLNERYWGQDGSDTYTETGVAGTYSTTTNDSTTEVDLDLAFVTMKEFLYSPLTMTLGRQELHFGNDMIIGDPDTNNAVTSRSAFAGTGDDADLSARKAFDAIRLTLNYDPLVVDVVAAKIAETTKNLDDDTNLYGINANYALNKKTTLEGYYWLKHEGRKAFISGTNTTKVRRVDVVGARVVTQPIDNLTYQIEGAYQFGKYHDGALAIADEHVVDRNAWALETFLTYDFKKVKYAPSATLGYAYFRGAAHDYTSIDAGHYRGWDPMYENQKFGDIANALFSQTNIHLLGLSGKAKITDDVTLKGEYYAFWWDKVYPNNHVISTVRQVNAATTTNRKFAAQEIDLTATYDYTEDVQFGLLTGILIPGPAFSGDSRNTASEVIGSMKVTF